MKKCKLCSSFQKALSVSVLLLMIYARFEFDSIIIFLLLFFLCLIYLLMVFLGSFTRGRLFDFISAHLSLIKLFTFP